MSHAAPIRALVLAVALALGDLMAAGPAQAGSVPFIFSVEVRPGGEISRRDEVSLAVEIITSSSPPVLFRPTEVGFVDGEIAIDIFADSAGLTIPGNLREIVMLGTFNPGTYPFTIELRGLPVGLVSDEFVGSFTVVPEPSSLALLATGMVALLLSRGARRTL